MNRLPYSYRTELAQALNKHTPGLVSPQTIQTAEGVYRGLPDGTKMSYIDVRPNGAIYMEWKRQKGDCVITLHVTVSGRDISYATRKKVSRRIPKDTRCIELPEVNQMLAQWGVTPL